VLPAPPVFQACTSAPPIAQIPKMPRAWMGFGWFGFTAYTSTYLQLAPTISPIPELPLTTSWVLVSGNTSCTSLTWDLHPDYSHSQNALDYMEFWL